MSEKLKCRLCETHLNKDTKLKSSKKQLLLQHFVDKHNISNKDFNVVNYLLLMHEQPINRKRTKSRQRSHSQDSLMSGKENETPTQTRVPLREKSTNVPPQVTKTRSGLKLHDVNINDVDTSNDEVLNDSILQPPKIWENMFDTNQIDEVEVCSPICVISNVSSAENLSSSILEDLETTKDQLNDSNVSMDSKNSSSSSLDTSWLSDSNYEIIHTRRLKTTAEHGRYICPDNQCSFKCESKVLLNIHIRKRHVEMFGAPIRKQRMMVYLDVVKVPQEIPESVSTESEESYSIKPAKLVFVDDSNIPDITNLPKKGIKRSGEDTVNEGDELPTKRLKVDSKSITTPVTVIKKEIVDEVARKKRVKVEKREESLCDGSKTDRERTIEKMRLLQSGKSNGTYVQCCVETCGKWRYLEGCEDPSLIPDTWQCSMNPNILRLVL